MRWFLEQIYVTSVKTTVENYKSNASGGCTISVRKRGGWGPSWQDALCMAGWSPIDGDMEGAECPEK